MAKYVKELLYKKINLYELEADIYESAHSPYTIRTIDTHSAIEILISKLTILENWNASAYGIYNTSTIERIKPYDRVFYFTTQNCNEQLLEVIEETCAFIKNYAIGFFKKTSFVIHLLNWINYGVSILALFVLLPFPYKVYRSIAAIIVLFFDISKEEKKKKIEEYERVRKKIIAHFSKIKKNFVKTNFAINKQFAGNDGLTNKNHNRGEDKRRDSIISYIQNNEGVSLKDNSEKSSMEAIQLLEEKRKIENIMTKR